MHIEEQKAYDTIRLSLRKHAYMYSNIQIYWKFYNQTKNRKKIQIKTTWYFFYHISA